jgi:hypothetical protein
MVARIDHYESKPYTGSPRTCQGARCNQLATVYLVYMSVSAANRASMNRRHLCDRHAERWLNQHTRQDVLFTI